MIADIFAMSMGFIALLIYFTIIFYIHDEETEHFKIMLKDEVWQEGGRNVLIKEVALLNHYLNRKHRREYRYEVSFTDNKQRHYLAKCYVQSSFLRGIDIRWEYAPGLLIYARNHPLEAVDVDAWLPEHYIYSDNPSKEVLLDGLTSLFRYERLATIRRMSELSKVDDVLIAKIRELSHSDPEREVAAVAREFLDTYAKSY